MNVFNNRNFTILYIRRSLMTLGNSFYIIALPWYILNQTHSLTIMGFVGLLETIPSLFSLFSGVFIDRYNKKKIIIFSDISSGVVLSALVYTALNIHNFKTYGIAIISTLVLLLEFIATFSGPAQSSILGRIIPREHLKKAMGLNQSTSAFLRLCGLMSGGVILTALGAPLLFMANAIINIISFMSLFFLHLEGENDSDQPLPSRNILSNFIPEWIEGIKIIYSNKIILRNSILSMILNLALVPFEMSIVAWVKESMHGTGLILGTIQAAILVGNLISGLLIKYIPKNIPDRILILISCAIMSFSIILFGIFEYLYIEVVISILFGCSLGIINSILPTITINSVQKSVQGRVFGILRAVDMLAAPIGLTLFTIAISHIHISIIIVFIGIIVLGAGSTFFPKVAENHDSNEDILST